MEIKQTRSQRLFSPLYAAVGNRRWDRVWATKQLLKELVDNLL